MGRYSLEYCRPLNECLPAVVADNGGGKRRAGISLLGRRGVESNPSAPAAPQTVMKIVATL